VILELSLAISIDGDSFPTKPNPLLLGGLAEKGAAAVVVVDPNPNMPLPLGLFADCPKETTAEGKDGAKEGAEEVGVELKADAKAFGDARKELEVKVETIGGTNFDEASNFPPTAPGPSVGSVAVVEDDDVGAIVENEGALPNEGCDCDPNDVGEPVPNGCGAFTKGWADTPVVHVVAVLVDAPIDGSVDIDVVKCAGRFALRIFHFAKLELDVLLSSSLE
jgi:hypothetical protein